MLLCRPLEHRRIQCEIAGQKYYVVSLNKKPVSIAPSRPSLTSSHGILTRCSSMAGYEYPPRAVSYYTRDVLLFANSIGATSDELQFLYVGGL